MSDSGAESEGGSGPPLPQAPQWRPKHNPWLITVAVMLGTFMEVLDTSVANVALPHMAGNLAATNEEATWVLTSYLVSNAIILPATGWLGRVFGRKRFLLVCITLFTAASFLCGASFSLGMLVAARVFQGVGGGALQPVAQSILLESFPPAKRGAAMAAFSVGVIFAPIIGPTLGGWITDNYSWRWIFYINIPVGALAFFMANWLIEDPPWIQHAAPGRIDAIGFGLMALGLATLQIILDKGQQEDWFSATWIRWATALTIISLILFVIRELVTPEPIVNLRILANRNFAIGTMLISAVGAVLYGTIVLLPLFLQQLMGYPALNSGLTMSPRGLGSLVLLPLIGKFSGRLDNRYLLAAGFATMATSTLLLSRINLQAAMITFIIPNIIGGAALALIFVPLTTMTMGLLRNEQIGNASGIYNLMRNIGGSVGISLVATLVARGAQTHQALLVSHLSPFDQEFQQRIQLLERALTSRVGPYLAERIAQGTVYNELLRQSSLLAFMDNFRLFGMMCIICVPLVFLFKRVRHGPAPGAAH